MLRQLRKSVLDDTDGVTKIDLVNEPHNPKTSGFQFLCQFFFRERVDISSVANVIANLQSIFSNRGKKRPEFG